MKIQPVKFNFINTYKTKKSLKLPQISYDSFAKVAFRGIQDEFIPAKTVDEAIKYGKSNFRIMEYYGFSDEDLDLLNWLNEGFYRLKCFMKKSPFIPPIKVKNTFGLDSDAAIEVVNSQLCLNKELFSKDAQFIKDIVRNSDLSSEEKAERLSNNLIFEAQKLEMQNNNGELVFMSPYSLIYHEMGHIIHEYNVGVSLFKQLSKSPKRKLSKTVQQYVNLFNKNKKTVASRVSNYATENILEFVAETFVGLCEGVKYDNKVMDLYLKLGGVEP